jgi:osmotically-inducible protein OsmY
MRIVTSLGVISTALVMAGCSTEPPPRAYSYTEYPSGEVVSTPRYNHESADRALEAGCRRELARYGDLATITPNVQIRARDGVVTLSGNVPAERERQMINACVKNTAGVVTVDDQLSVGYAPTGTYSQSTTVYEPPRTTVYEAPATPVPAPSRTTVYEAPATTVPAPSSSVVVVTEPTPAYEQRVQIITVRDTDRDLAERIADSIRAQAVFPPGDASVTVQVTGGRAEVRGTVEHGSEKHKLLEAVRHTPGVIEVKDHVHVR